LFLFLVLSLLNPAVHLRRQRRCFHCFCGYSALVDGARV